VVEEDDPPSDHAGQPHALGDVAREATVPDRMGQHQGQHAMGVLHRPGLQPRGHQLLHGATFACVIAARVVLVELGGVRARPAELRPGARVVAAAPPPPRLTY
jgi:hypothetical protein